LSGERVNLLKSRSRRFLGLGLELLQRGDLELAAFNIHESCQLRLKAFLLRILSEIPKMHSVRELLGILSAKLEEAGFVEVSARIKGFAKLYRDELVDLDSAYIASRYTFFTFTRGDVEKLAQVCSELHSLLEEVEKSVLG